MRRSTTLTLLGAAALAAGAGCVPPAAAGEQPSSTAVAATAASSEKGASGASSANPLWGIALKQLSNTRDRPLFSPSRRPPPPVVVAPSAVASTPAPKLREPEKPNLVLLGTIANGDDGYGIFMDQDKKKPVRIRIGAAYRDWVLRNIKSGIATLQNAEDSLTLTLPKQTSGQRESVSRVEGAIASERNSKKRNSETTGQTPEPRSAQPRQIGPLTSQLSSGPGSGPAPPPPPEQVNVRQR